MFQYMAKPMFYLDITAPLQGRKKWPISMGYPSRTDRRVGFRDACGNGMTRTSSPDCMLPNAASV